jgi:cyclophilin family peptidyl-prolyl cis-trans isomerase
MRRLPSLVAGLFVLAAALAVPLAGPAAAQSKGDLENMLYLDLTHGRVVIKLRPDLAPSHVARIKELARQKFYDNHVFHRVIAGFMAQTGDPTGTGTGGSGKRLKAEFTQEPFKRGTLGMARSQSPDSADSQFFICFGRADWLDGQYTVWGEVVEGMDLVDKIAKGEPPAKPDKIVSLRVAADAEKK